MSIYNGDIKVAGAGATTPATQSANGLMSSGDKVILDRLATPSYIQLIGSSGVQQALTTGWVSFKKWNTYEGTGVTQGIMVVDVANGTITCNFNGYIEVSGSVHFNGFTAGHALGARIYKGGEIVWTYNVTPSATYYLAIIPTVITPVTYGQVITLDIVNFTTTAGNAGYNVSNTTFGNTLLVRRI